MLVGLGFGVWGFGYRSLLICALLLGGLLHPLHNRYAPVTLISALPLGGLLRVCAALILARTVALAAALAVVL